MILRRKLKQCSYHVSPQNFHSHKILSALCGTSTWETLTHTNSPGDTFSPLLLPPAVLCTESGESGGPEAQDFVVTFCTKHFKSPLVNIGHLQSPSTRTTGKRPMRINDKDMGFVPVVVEQHCRAQSFTCSAHLFFASTRLCECHLEVSDSRYGLGVSRVRFPTRPQLALRGICTSPVVSSTFAICSRLVVTSCGASGSACFLSSGPLRGVSRSVPLASSPSPLLRGAPLVPSPSREARPTILLCLCVPHLTSLTVGLCCVFRAYLFMDSWPAASVRLAVASGCPTVAAAFV